MKKYGIIFFTLLLTLLIAFPAKAQSDPDSIVIVAPPDSDTSLLQPFPPVFNMDTDVVDWEDYTFYPFAGAELARIVNPDKSGLNETDYVLEYTKPEGSDAWAGFFYHLENPVNLTDESVFKLNVWSPRADIEAILKLEVQGGPATGDLKADVTTAGEWIELVWDLSDQNQETNWDLVVVIMDLDVHPVPETETWYLDDFSLEGVVELDPDRIVIVEPTLLTGMIILSSRSRVRNLHVSPIPTNRDLTNPILFWNIPNHRAAMHGQGSFISWKTPSMLPMSRSSS
jgi:hypothetical protein